MKQEEIAKFITQRLKERNLTQVQLSKQINRYKYINIKMRKGKTLMDLSLYDTLSSIFNIKISEFLHTKN